MPKRLIGLLDGTGNSPESGAPPTHVQTLKELIAAGMVDALVYESDLSAGWEVKKYLGLNGELDRTVFYNRGLGAPQLDDHGNMLAWSFKNPRSFFKLPITNKFLDAHQQLSASGIMDDVADIYQFLVKNYEPGDFVYIFGFSRGAYTAKLLTSVLRYVGLLDKKLFATQAQIDEAVQTAFSLYRMDIHPDENEEAIQFRETYSHDSKHLITFLGLWDCVRGMIAEHVHADGRLSSVVHTVRHAIAADERRSIFKPEVHSTGPEVDSVQKWFPGVHCDIGGGYVENGLALVALHWMLAEAALRGLKIPDEILSQDKLKPDPLAKQHDSYNALIQSGMPIKWSNVCKIYRRPIAQMNTSESLHESILCRYGHIVLRDSATILYRPSNLRHVLHAYENLEKTRALTLIAAGIPNNDEYSDIDNDTSLVKQESARKRLRRPVTPPTPRAM